MVQNVGKRFESDFISSVKQVSYCWHKRLNDNASSWSGGSNTRFASTNECDFLIFDCNSRTLSALELKSTSGSLTFYREDFDTGDKHRHFSIKKNQILGLQKWSSFLMNCGFIFNFRNNDNDTYYVSINNFTDYTSALSKKSINMDDVLRMNPIRIECKKMRTRYKYDIEKFINDLKIS